VTPAVADAKGRIPLQSSVLEAVSYDQSRRSLTVWFVSGSVYRYSGVPPHVVRGLLAPPDGSHGRAFSRLVRGRYPYEQLPG
jgi:hypothetical protein